MMVFYIDAKNNVILHPDAIKLCPELALLDDKEVLFIIKAFDYHSPYRQYPERQRISKAIWDVYQDNNLQLLEPDKRPRRIVNAIEAYKGLQYDRNIELVEMYNKKIDELIELLAEEKSNSGIKNLTDSVDRLKKNIRAIESEILDQKMTEGEIRGNVKLSWLEKMESNIKVYAAVTAKRI